MLARISRWSSNDDPVCLQVFTVDISIPHMTTARMELAATANPDTPSSFAVGVWSEQEKKFKPIFRVDENGVTISGTLVANEVLKPLKPVRTSEEALAILRNRRLSDQVMNNAGVLNLLGKLVEGVFSRRGDADDDIPRQ